MGFLFLIASQLVNIDFKERYKEYFDGVLRRGLYRHNSYAIACCGLFSINMSLVGLNTDSGIAIIANRKPYKGHTQKLNRQVLGIPIWYEIEPYRRPYVVN